MTVRSVRRQEFKKNTARIYKTNEIDIFLTLYREMFLRQGITVDESAIELIRKICLSALDGGYGRFCKAQVDGEIHAMTFFLFDENFAYYLFAANNPVHRSSGSATALMFDNINWAAKKGLKAVDFVGVNSPNRGDFKISFNSYLKPYYEIKLSAYK
jgi:CelD/BcsL family acetyltransferase involved in cellulose biosynthesis